MLRDVDRRFRRLLNDETKQIPGLVGMEACENHFVIHRPWLPSLWQVVTDEFAGNYFGAVTVLRNTDHFSTVKPDNRRHPAHQLLTDFWRRFETVATPAHIQRPHQGQFGSDVPTTTSVEIDIRVSGLDAYSVRVTVHDGRADRLSDSVELAVKLDLGPSALDESQVADYGRSLTEACLPRGPARGRSTGSTSPSASQGRSSSPRAPKPALGDHAGSEYIGPDGSGLKEAVFARG
jgi:hypothetical protein